MLTPLLSEKTILPSVVDIVRIASTMSPPPADTKRIFLRARTSSADQAGLQDDNLVDLFLTKAGFDNEDTGQHTRHFVHNQPREYEHFHIILDINYRQDPDANVKELVHEVYRVRFDGNNTEP